MGGLFVSYVWGEGGGGGSFALLFVIVVCVCVCMVNKECAEHVTVLGGCSRALGLLPSLTSAATAFPFSSHSLNLAPCPSLSPPLSLPCLDPCHVLPIASPPCPLSAPRPQSPSHHTPPRTAPRPLPPTPPTCTRNLVPHPSPFHPYQVHPSLQHPSPRGPSPHHPPPLLAPPLCPFAVPCGVPTTPAAVPGRRRRAPGSQRGGVKATRKGAWWQTEITHCWDSTAWGAVRDW